MWLASGIVTLIDVRPTEEFEPGHIEGASSVPLDRVKEWAKSAPKRKQVVAYCRGPYRVYALKALAVLRKRGITGLRAEDGARGRCAYTGCGAISATRSARCSQASPPVRSG
jgi:ArsR family transcriptional regulator